MGIDFNKKKIFLLDLDDTLIQTTLATEWGLRCAYNKLCKEYLGDDRLDKHLSFEEFKCTLFELYSTLKNPKTGKKYRDYEVEIIEHYCNENLPTKSLPFEHNLFALAARLFWDFKEGKNGALIPYPEVYALFDVIRTYGYALCITEGRCNYQHTKVMRTGLEKEFEDVIVFQEDKKEELKKHIDNQLKIHPNIQKSNYVLIGDNPKDIVAGQYADIDTVRIMTGGHSTKNDIVSPTERFNNLTELIKRLRNE